MRKTIAALFALVALAGCGAEKSASPAVTSPPARFPLTLTTGAGTVTLPAAPRRIVSLSPTATEMLFAIHAGTQVVAVLVLTELFGVRLELATSFAILIWLLTFVVIVPVGAALAFKEGLDWHSLRQIGREAAKE